MRNARDTFLHYLADNLPSLKVHPLRNDVNDPSARVLQVNAINVEFLDLRLETGDSSFRVAVDVLGDDESTVLDMIQSIWDLFKSSFYTPILDYTDPDNPASTDLWLFWDRDKVRFTRIAGDRYSRYSCVLPLRYSQN